MQWRHDDSVILMVRIHPVAVLSHHYMGKIKKPEQLALPDWNAVARILHLLPISGSLLVGVGE